MDSSFLYHALGLYSHKCTKEKYKGTVIILHVETKERKKTCPLCGHTHLVKNGCRIRDFVGIPIGGKKTAIRMKVKRYKCMNAQCSYDRLERLPFAAGSCSYAHRFARYVIGLLKAMSHKEASSLPDVSWDTIKDIRLSYLERHYSPPSLDGVGCIGIDEFAVKKGHIHKTIVVDLRTGMILYAGDGRRKMCRFSGYILERSQKGRR